MLVLSRLRDETIMIGDDIEITVVDIRGDKVRLGITAPSRIAVHRKEVYEAIRNENERASRVGDADIESIRQTLSPGPLRAQSGERNAGENGAVLTPRVVPTRAPSVQRKRA